MKHIVEKVDHTLLKAFCTEEEIIKLCDKAKELKVASICIPPCYVKLASDYLKGEIPVCTVIGFPLGYNTTSVKIAEAKESIENGASEIDMVINISDAKMHKFDRIEEEIKQIKEAIGDNILKVIIETCYLDKEEKIELCKVVTRAGADFIKTSTGFGTNGATLEDIKHMKENVGTNVRIKAAGGIKSLKDAEDFIKEGATRLGTSSICSIIKNETIQGY